MELLGKGKLQGNVELPEDTAGKLIFGALPGLTLYEREIYYSGVLGGSEALLLTLALSQWCLFILFVFFVAEVISHVIKISLTKKNI